MAKTPTYNELLIEVDYLKGRLLEKNNQTFLIKESEERFRTIFHSANAAIATTDNTGKFIECNELWEKTFGYTINELKNLTNIDITHPDDIALTKAYTVDLLSGKLQNLRIEKRYLAKNKSVVWVDLSISFLRINNILNFYGVAIDITDRKNAEFKLQVQNVELQKLIETKDKFISILAHDLRNPFSALIGFSDLLKENLSKYTISEIERYVNIINETSRNTASFLESLLKWAASQQNTLPFTPMVHNLFLMVNQSCQFVKNDAEFKNITIIIEIQENTLIYADSEMAKAVLRNLLTNAIKFTHNMGKIVVSACIANNFVEVTVSDSGVGMDEMTKSTIFKIGKTVTTKGTNNEQGTGFGLLLCKEFVEKHGGQIWVESELGMGSKFKFTVPKSEN